MTFNYVEYVLLENDPVSKKDYSVYNIDLSNDHFKQVFTYFKHKYQKYSERLIKQYMKHDLYYEVTHDKDSLKYNDVKVYSKVGISCDVEKNYICAKYYKQKLQFHSFPSSAELHCIQYVKRQTFRCNSRIYVNFDLAKIQGSDHIVKKVFINVNLDSNTDNEFLITEVNKIIIGMHGALLASQAPCMAEGRPDQHF